MVQQDYWLKQTPDSPIFPDLLWSRPEHKAQAGKLLIIGGNLHGFIDPAEAYAHALKAGAGSVRVLLPNAVHKLAGAVLTEVTFAPSTPSGSFGQQALAEVLENATWADGVLLAGNFGHNSETTILLEKLLHKHTGQITLTKDAVDSLINSELALLDKNNRLYILTMAQLQKLGTRLRLTQPITFGMDLIQLVASLHEMTMAHQLTIIVKHLDQYLVAVGGRVSSTKAVRDTKKWRVQTAADCATWWLQNQSKPFEALTTAVYELTQ